MCAHRNKYYYNRIGTFFLFQFHSSAVWHTDDWWQLSFSTHWIVIQFWCDQLCCLIFFWAYKSWNTKGHWLRILIAITCIAKEEETSIAATKIEQKRKQCCSKPLTCTLTMFHSHAWNFKNIYNSPINFNFPSDQWIHL